MAFSLFLRPFSFGVPLAVLALLCLTGCQHKVSRGFDKSLAVGIYAPDAPAESETPVSTVVNGFAVREWQTGIADSSTFEQDGAVGTARARDGQPHDWVWISIDGIALPDLGEGCFLRVTDGKGRVIDTEDGQNVELALKGKSDPNKTPPVRMAVFRMPPRWSSTPDVSLELYSQKALLAAWHLDGVPHQDSSLAKAAAVETKVDDLTFVTQAVTEFSTRPHGALDKKVWIEIRLEDPQDRELRWVAEITKGLAEPLTVVGRGKVAQRVPVPLSADPGDTVPFRAKVYAFTTRAALSYYVYCSMKEQEDGSPEFRSGANVIVNLVGGGGRFSVDRLFSTGKRRADGSYDFTFPCRWTAGGKTLVGRDLGVGGTVPAILRSTRGTVVPTVKPGDSFTLRMQPDEVEYLKGGRFTFELWFETRKLLAEAEVDKPLTCIESPIWTQRAALARSDEMTHAGE